MAWYIFKYHPDHKGGTSVLFYLVRHFHELSLKKEPIRAEWTLTKIIYKTTNANIRKVFE